MMQTMQSLQPAQAARRSLRGRLSLRQELTLALLPATMVLIVFAIVENLSHQRLLFASLASSAFLIYLDPQHGANSARSLAISQSLAAVIGYGAHALLGDGYFSAAAAIITIVVLMIVLDVVHPPAIATALSFAFRAGPESNLLLFGLAVGLIVLLIGLQRAMLWLLQRYVAGDQGREGEKVGNPL